MDGHLPRRADTALTFTSKRASRDSVENTVPQPVTPVRTLVGPRRNTLSHRKLVFVDPVAFRYLEEDDSTIVLARRERLRGYELYIVEQWVCSRIHPTFAITTYTGDPSHSILVNVLAVPNEEKNWSDRLKVYFDAISQFHAREQETPLGTLMVTNLSAFPSAFTVISVPDGDVRKHREDFIVNEDLKKMGCTGRAAMNLQPAPPSTMAKFHHLYQTSEGIPFRASVMELVRLCQTSLVLYGKLNAIYADGLLCDITENAIRDWWNDIGTDFHNVEPSDGILGPTTVAALIGLMIGAYNRIRATGINVPKDVLDVLPMKRAIGQFQKAHKLNKSRRLDRDTLDRLHRVTAKSAISEGWAVPRAVKSTVAELSGKGGEMVMGAIGANKEKVAISEIETLEIDKLAQLVHGARMKWLWQGKPLKSNQGDMLGLKGDDGLNGRIFSTDEQGNYLWTSVARGSVDENANGNDSATHDRSRVKRLGDAVGIPGLRSHNNRSRKHGEDHTEKDDLSAQPKTSRNSREQLRPDFLIRSPSLYSRSSLERQDSAKPALDLALANAATEAPVPAVSEQPHTKLQNAQDHVESGHVARREQLRPAKPHVSDLNASKRAEADMKKYHDQIQGDQYQNFITEFEEGEPEAMTLRRPRSALQIRDFETPIAHNLRLPRQLSFSLVETSILKFPQLRDNDEIEFDRVQVRSSSLKMKMSFQEREANKLKQLAAKIAHIEHTLLVFAQAEIAQVEELDQESRNRLTELNEIYYQRLDEYQSLQATSRDLVAREKASLNDGLRRIEMLGQKLDYELDALESRMHEVEDGADDFERNVVEIEARVEELIHERRSLIADRIDELEERSIPWFQRAVNFFSPSQK